jgi:hypothetical protein
LTAPVPKDGVDVVIGHDRDLAADERQHHGGAHDVAVALVVRVHRHARVAEHRLGTGGGDHDVVAAAHRLGERIAEVPQVAVEVLVLHLDVGKRGRAPRAPVDDALAPVDESLVVPVDEDLAHRRLVRRVHREPLVGVVARAAHRLELADDGRAVLTAPLPALPR